VEVAKGE